MMIGKKLIMKKLLIIPLILIVFACSSDEIGDDLTNTVDPIIGVWTGDGDTLIFRSNGDLILDGYTGGWINNDGNADFNSVNQSYTLISVEDEIEFKDPFLNVKFSNDFNSFTSPGLPGTATRQ